MTNPLPNNSNVCWDHGQPLLAYDWFSGQLPQGLALGKDVYIDSSYGFDMCSSTRQPCLELGDGSGLYDRATIITGPNGHVKVGRYSVINGSYLIANQSILIGNHVLLAWGAVITDSWEGRKGPDLRDSASRRKAMQMTGKQAERPLPEMSDIRSVVIEDNVWVGFDAVVLPGVRLGRGCVVAAKTVVDRNVEPYCVVGGMPLRVIRQLSADDTPDAIFNARATHLRQAHL